MQTDIVRFELSRDVTPQIPPLAKGVIWLRACPDSGCLKV